MVQTMINKKQQSAKNICHTAQVRAVTSKLGQTFNSSCGLLGPHSYSSQFSISAPVDLESEGPGNSATGRKKTGNLCKINMYILFLFIYFEEKKLYFHVTLIQKNRDYLNVVYN